MSYGLKDYWDEEVDNLFPKVGAKIRVAPNTDAKRVFHVLAIVDGDQIVVKEWSARKGWRYSVEWFYLYKNKDYCEIENPKE